MFTKLSLPDLHVMPPENVNPKPNTHNLFWVESYSKPLMDLAFNLLETHKYPGLVPIDEKNYREDALVEDHIYLMTEENHRLNSKFSTHCDDFGGKQCTVHTCIFYLENTFERGGDLEITEADREDAKALETIDTRKWNVVLLHGATPHRITPMFGKGRRRCIVVQFRANRS